MCRGTIREAEVFRGSEGGKTQQLETLNTDYEKRDQRDLVLES